MKANLPQTQKNKLKHIPKRPKGISERTYRKHMAKKIKKAVQSKEFEFTMPSIQWLGSYQADNEDATLDQKMDDLFKQVITKPDEVSLKGVNASIFENGNDIPLILEVNKAINTFLTKPTVNGNENTSTASSQG